MKKRLKKLSVTMLVLGLIYTSHVQAAIVSKTIELPIDTWVDNKVTKNSELQYTLAKCIAVYPTSGKDNYHRIKVRVKQVNNEDILSTKNYYVLVEGENYTKIQLKKYVGAGEKVNVQFKGNNPDKAARTEVSFTGN